MPKIRKYRVLPSLPEELSALPDLAHNLYWTWHHDIQALFRRLDREGWERNKHNPVLLLGEMPQTDLEKRAQDDSYLSHLERAVQSLQEYLNTDSWFHKSYGDDEKLQIAYFSMEYGLAECLPIYSGGLGILAADHLKSASDLGIPLVGVGLLYQEGYFQQYLTTDGYQREKYIERDFYNMPLKIQRDENGKPVKISVDFPGRKVYAQIWRAQVGRVPLYLLDTNIPENSHKDQNITDRLYGGDNETRIEQEILLGIGGIRALEAVGIKPDVCHMNEGHSAFLALERIRQVMRDHGLTFKQAHEATRGGNVFTSHTPVPAGIDEFELPLIDQYFSEVYETLKLSREEFHRLGGAHLPQTQGKFNMAIFAINMAGSCNGVSKLHGKVARKMWNYLWPDVPEQEVPIGHVTNGIHFRTWISEELADLLNRYLGPKWYLNPVDEDIWKRVDEIPDEELWRAHERQREQLVVFARNKLKEQLETSGVSQSQLQEAHEVLNPKALTIGFARRFAEYKRASLIFKDLERLSKILNDIEKPVQIILAGKAHPKDEIGKKMIRELIHIIRSEGFRHHVIFLEDYDIQIASLMVQGVDVWLNTPRRPREASGTSGMKAGANGVLNLSTLDGWWDEAYRPDLGWAIGRGEEYGEDEKEEQDRIESELIYHLLENEIIPLFYRRGPSEIPRRWIQMMKNSIKFLGPVFNTNRMVRDYFTSFYLPAAKRWQRLSANNMETAKTLAAWKEKVYKNWDKVRFLKVVSENGERISVGQQFKVKAWLEMDGLSPDDVSVEVFYGHLHASGEIVNGKVAKMEVVQKEADKSYLYETAITAEKTGHHGFAVRVLPYHPELNNPFEMGLITWDESANGE